MAPSLKVGVSVLIGNSREDLGTSSVSCRRGIGVTGNSRKNSIQESGRAVLDGNYPRRVYDTDGV